MLYQVVRILEAVGNPEQAARELKTAVMGLTAWELSACNAEGRACRHARLRNASISALRVKDGALVS